MHLIERVLRLSTKKKKEAENFGGEIAKGLGQVSRTVAGSGARWRRHLLLLRPGLWPWLGRGRGIARHRGRFAGRARIGALACQCVTHNEEA